MNETFILGIIAESSPAAALTLMKEISSPQKIAVGTICIHEMTNYHNILTC